MREVVFKLLICGMEGKRIMGEVETINRELFQRINALAKINN